MSPAVEPGDAIVTTTDLKYPSGPLPSGARLRVLRTYLDADGDVEVVGAASLFEKKKTIAVWKGHFRKAPPEECRLKR